MSGRLTPEQEKALNVFKQYKPILNQLVANSGRVKRNGSLLPTDFVATSFAPYKKSKIPREKHWSWNQSNSKVTVQVDEHMGITFRKISPRKRPTTEKAPSYKIWLYHVHTEPELFFLWCEKGVDNCGINTEIGTIFPGDLSMESLSFLHPFVDGETAVAFGWLQV